MKARGGAVAVIGRPNVGKSTFLNAVLGDRVSIVSPKQQTTRTVIRAITEAHGARFVWMDTPGFQKKYGGALNRSLNAAVDAAAADADVIVFMSVACRWSAADAAILERLPADKPVIAAINKIDNLPDKNALLPAIADMQKRRDFAAIVPISARTDGGFAALLGEIAACFGDAGAPASAPPADDEREFHFAELLREKLFRLLDEELPYSVGVVAEDITETSKLLKVTLLVYTQKESQKRMIIGKNGQMLKKIATAARHDMQKSARKKIFLSVVVKVEVWQDNPEILRKMRIGRIV